MKATLLVLFLIAAVNCVAQSNFSSSARTNITFHAPPKGFITQLAPPPPGQEGTFYLYDELTLADIFLKDSSRLENVKVKIDLQDNFVEIEYKNQMKMLPVGSSMGLLLKKNTGDEMYINGDALPSAEYRNYLLQVIYDGKVQLLCRTTPEVIKASGSQNPMLDVGKKDDKIVMRKNYLIVNGNKIVEASVSKSAFKTSMTQTFGADIEPLLKGVNNKNVDDLLTLVKELNSRL